jgi:hypothetical protein
MRHEPNSVHVKLPIKLNAAVIFICLWWLNWLRNYPRSWNSNIRYYVHKIPSQEPVYSCPHINILSIYISIRLPTYIQVFHVVYTVRIF